MTENAKAAPVNKASDHSTLPRIVRIRLQFRAVWIASVDSNDLGVLVKVRNDN